MVPRKFLPIVLINFIFLSLISPISPVGAQSISPNTQIIPQSSSAGLSSLISALQSILQALQNLLSLRILPVSQLASLTGSGSGLVGYWAFDEGAGNTVLDSSGNVNNATLNGSPAWTPGRVGSALNFSGSNQYVSFQPKIANLGAYTIAGWVKTTLTTEADVYSEGNGSNGTPFVRLVLNRYASGQVGFEHRPDVGAMVSQHFQVGIGDSLWHHVAVVRNGTTWSVYADGVLRGSQTGTVGATTVTRGCAGALCRTTNSNFFNGSIDEVFIYNRALSSTEIFSLANPTGPIFDTAAPSTPTNLAGTAVSQTQINLAWSVSADNVAVTGYKVFRNGIQVGTATTPAYSDPSLSAGTSYSYTVSAYDAAGNNSAQSNVTTVFTQSVSTNSFPAVSITSPTDGKTYTAPASITINANASDTGGSITKVDFFQGSVLLGTSNASPYSFTWSNVPAGSYVLTAKATDNSGSNAMSSPVSIIVNPADSNNLTFHYVSPNGSSAGTGSISSPWDLQTALNQPAGVIPGDTIWLRGGTYRPVPPGGTAWVLQSKLAGTASNPIVVRGYPGEKAIIDGGTYDVSTLYINGGYTWFMDLEIMSSSDEARFSPDDSSFPASITRSDGPSVFGPGIKLINLVIHDLTAGINAWGPAANFEAYGNVVYNNGWQGTPSAHGHNVYSQNYASSNPGKVFTNNIFINPYQKNLQAYGSSAASITHYRIHNNTFINRPALIGGRSEALLQDNQLINNYFYGNGFSLYYPANSGAPTSYNDVVATGNYVVDGTFEMSDYWKQATIQNNSFINTKSGVRLTSPTDGLLVSYAPYVANNYPAYVWSNNVYYSGPNSATTAMFVVQGSAPSNFSSWKTASGYDSGSVINNGLPTTNKIIFQPNQYDSNRANIIIYNWQNLNTVNIDISSLGWQSGDNYELHSAQNYFGDVVFGTYGGTPLSIDMSASKHSVAIPYGAPQAIGTNTFPKFGAFVLVRTSGSVTTPPPISDTTPPSVPTNLAGTAISQSQINLTWNASTDNIAVTGYKIFRGGIQIGTATTPAYSDTGLSASTAYIYTVSAQDAAGNSSGQSGSVIATTKPLLDTQAPVVSITAPLAGFAVSGIVVISANATDNVAVIGVQFKLDGANLGTELTTAPYSGTWNTTGVSNGVHTLTATARDAAGNVATSGNVAVTVSNSSTPPPLSPDVAPPSVPTGLTATSITQTSVTLSWFASADNVGVTGYQIYRNGTSISIPLTPTYADFGRTAGTTYSYTVSARDAAGNWSAQSSPLSVTTIPLTSTKFVTNGRVQVAQTLNVRSTASPTGTFLGSQPISALGTVTSGPTYNGGFWWWNINYDSGADGWSVEDYLVKYTAPIPTYTLTIAKGGTGGGVISGTGITCGSDCNESFNGGTSVTLAATPASGSTFAGWSGGGCSGTGSCSITLSANTTASAIFELTAPSNLSPTISLTSPSNNFTTTAPATLTLSANASDSDGTISKVEFFQGAALLNADTISPYTYLWSSVPVGTYTITARATDNGGGVMVSAPASVIIAPSAIVDIAPPSVPTGLIATPISSSQINLSWNASIDTTVTGRITSGLTGYKLYRNGTQIVTIAATSYSNSGLASNTLYSYTIAAYDAAGNTSQQSVAVQASTQAPPITPVTPPVPSNGSPSSALPAGTTQTTLSLGTDKAATCKYGLVAGTPYSSLPISFTTTGSTTHSTLVSALTDGSSYTYYVRCSSQGFPTTGDYIISFSVTPPAPAPSAPPAPVSGGTPPPSGGGGSYYTPPSTGSFVPTVPQAPVGAGGIFSPNTPSQNPIAASAFRFTRPLKLGLNNADIKLLQQFLNSHGFTVSQTGLGSRGQETTYFGLATFKALIRFQEAHRADILTPNGITKGTGYFGALSIKKVNEILASEVLPTAASPQQASSNVVELQRQLSVLLEMLRALQAQAQGR